MPQKEPGYIFILTNPSFKEDWVKIVTSNNPDGYKQYTEEKHDVPLLYCLYAVLKIETTKKTEDIYAILNSITFMKPRHIFNSCFYHGNPKYTLDKIYSAAYDSRIETSIYEDDETICVQIFDHGFIEMYFIPDIEIETKDDDLVDDDTFYDFRYVESGWSDRELADAYDAAYEGHSRLELGLEG